MNDRYVIIRDEQDTGTGRGLYLDQILWEPDCGIRAGGIIRHDGENLLVRPCTRTAAWSSSLCRRGKNVT